MNLYASNQPGHDVGTLAMVHGAYKRIHKQSDYIRKSGCSMIDPSRSIMARHRWRAFAAPAGND
jgi:hypothetical protein